jgi:hypothetical protein
VAVEAGLTDADARGAVRAGWKAAERLRNRYKGLVAGLRGDGGKVVRALGLSAWLVKPLMLWEARARMRERKFAAAARLLERLHSKDAPFLLDRRNWAGQMLLMSRAYVGMGRLDVATIFFKRSKRAYPILKQQWAVLRSLRVLIALGGRGQVKGG